MRIGIFGSCVSRDMFGEHTRHAIQPYAARSSVASVMAPPLSLGEAEVHLDSAFQRRCLLADFNKTFFAALEAASPDILIVDLVDERFNLLRASGTIVTESLELFESGLRDDERFAFELLRRDEEPAAALYDEALPRFAERLLRVLPRERIVLHEAYWLTRFRDEGGRIQPFPDERIEWAEFQNALVGRGYDILRDALGDGPRIALAPEEYVADAAHKWGAAPIHYEDAYYDEALRHVEGLPHRPAK